MAKLSIDELLAEIGNLGMSARDTFFQGIVTRFLDDVLIAMRYDLSDAQKREVIRKIELSIKNQ